MSYKSTNLAEINLGAEFTWGKIIQTHEIGPYIIIECEPKVGDIGFHPYVNGICTHYTSKTLEGALLLAISFKIRGITDNNAIHNARNAAKILEVKSDY